METFIVYLLKTGIWIGIFGMVYCLFLRRETFYRFNRQYLLAGLLLSCLIPVIQLRYTVEIAAPTSFDLPATSAEALSANTTFDWTFALLMIYVCGIVVVFVRYFVGLRKIVNLLMSQSVRKISSFCVVNSPDLQHPFSIFNYIFINSQAHSDVAQKMILEHEQTHIRQKHWIDLAIGNLICILQWFNPFAWLYIKAMKQNHEYLADRSVLQNGHPPAYYRAVLLSYTLNVHASALAHSFAHAGKLNRFLMMKKPASNPLRKGTVLLIFPVLAVFLWTFAQPVYIFEKQNMVHKEPEITVIDMASAPAEIIVKEAEKGSILPKQIEEQVVRVSTSNTTLEASLPLVLLDGVEVPYSTIKTINAAIIQSIDVLKNESVLSLYGEKGKNGVISIQTKTQSNMLSASEADKSSILPKQIEEQVVRVNTSNTTLEASPPLVLLDGVEVSPSTLKTINPAIIQSIDVLKNESVLSLYGEKGKNGVISIQTKTQSNM